MKATIEGITIEGVTILGKWEGLGLYVEWSAPAENVNAANLLNIRQSGFRFRIVGDTCYITSRQPYTKFE